MRAMVMSVTLLLAIGSSVGAAQTRVPVPPGSVVRVATGCRQDPRDQSEVREPCRWERGVVVGAGSEGLTWRPDAGSMAETHPWSAIGAVEVSRGKRRHVMKGLVIGAVAGAVPGALSGASYAETCECGSPNYAGGAVIGAVIFAVPAGLLGAGIGALVQSERWERVSGEALRVSVAPRPGGLGVSLAVRF